MTEKQLNTTNKGFTLVELLVGMAIFSIISLVLVQQFSAGSRVSTEQSAASRAQQSLRIARIMMNQDIRLAGLDPIRSFQFGFEECRGVFRLVLLDRQVQAAHTRQATQVAPVPSRGRKMPTATASPAARRHVRLAMRRRRLLDCGSGLTSP